jgi:CheY-like chemotaxis protein
MSPEPSNILIVEDEEAHAELTRRAIQKSGRANRIDIVSDGEEALEYLTNTGKYGNKEEYPSPVLILLDIKLPGIDGIEVLKKIKEHPTLKKIPVIMLTTSQREEDVAASYGHYANSYLTKPVGFKEFEEKVMNADFYWLKMNEPPVPEES